VDPVTRRSSGSRSTDRRDWYSLGSRSSRSRQEQAEAEEDPAGHDSAECGAVQSEALLLSDEFSLVDATIAPVLWRLPYYEIDVPPQRSRSSSTRASCSRGRLFGEGFQKKSRRCVSSRNPPGSRPTTSAISLLTMANLPPKRPYLLRASINGSLTAATHRT